MPTALPKIKSKEWTECMEELVDDFLDETFGKYETLMNRADFLKCLSSNPKATWIFNGEDVRHKWIETCLKEQADQHHSHK